MTFHFHRRLVLWNIIILLLVVFIAGSNLARSLLALAAGILLTLLIRYILKVRVAAPLSELSSVIQKIGDGDLTPRISVKGDADVAELLRATNMMARHLQQTTNALHDGRRRAESFVDAMTEGVLLLDPAGKITIANRAFSRMIATDRDLSGKTTLDIFRNPELESSIQKVLSGEAPRVVGFAHTNGRFAEAHIAGIPNLAGVVDSAVVVFHDLTEIRKTERMRRDFVANVSHEFKTPLTAIRGYTETLLGGALEDPKIASDFLHIVQRNARHLEDLVSDLLTLARLEAELPASSDTVNVRTLVEEQLALREAAIAGRDLRVVNECPDIQVCVDRARLTTALSNLIDNAVYYNRPSGQIRISGGQDNGSFLLSIDDTGEGIPPTDLQRIFERFYRVDKARARDSGGTGLGLSIVKHAVESQGGSITVSSKLGTGSHFSIRLPLRRGE
jgi:two-component system, OmpR family, phosphate regulon sensor histidine kinase PhoR